MSHAFTPRWVVLNHDCGPNFKFRAMRGGGHRGGPGFGPGFGGPGFGPGRGFGGPGGPRGRGRARRGDVRSAALLLLEEQPRNGYQLMQELETRSDGLWRPSPGSVYPALAQLEDEGLIASAEADGKKVFQLTDAGRAHVEERREQLGSPWKAVAEGVPEGVGALFFGMGQLGMAVEQVARGGSEEQIAEVKKILNDARKAVYRLLAGEDEEPEG